MQPRKRPTIGKLQAPVEIWAELDWYYLEAESAIGMRSALGAALRRVETRVFSDQERQVVDPDEERRRRAVHKLRRVQRIMRKLPGRIVAVLDAAYEAHQWPAPLTAMFGDGAGVVCRMASARRAFREATGKRKGHNKSVMQWLADLATAGTAEERQTLRRLKGESDALVAEAIKAYMEARTQCGSGDLSLAA